MRKPRCLFNWQNKKGGGVADFARSCVPFLQRDPGPQPMQPLEVVERHEVMKALGKNAGQCSLSVFFFLQPFLVIKLELAPASRIRITRRMGIACVGLPGQAQVRLAQ